MSDAKQSYSVRATDLLFKQFGGSFVLHYGEGLYPFRKGSPGRQKGDEVIGKVEPKLEHQLELTEREAAGLARDGYSVEKVKAAKPAKDDKADKAKAEG